MKSKGQNKPGMSLLKKIIITAIFIFAVAIVINIAPNYIRNEITDKINLIINNNNVTKSLKYDVFIGENEAIYISTKDVANFFDEDIFYDNKYNQIITTQDTKIATIELNKNELEINRSKANNLCTSNRKRWTILLTIFGNAKYI